MPRTARKLTKKDLDDLRARAEADPTFHGGAADAGQPGLYAIAAGGKVRFIFRFTPPGGGKRRTVAIDTYGAITLEQARKVAAGLRAQVAERVDPAIARAEVKRAGATVADAVTGYLADFAERAENPASKRGKPGSLVAMRGLLERHVLPELGAKRLRDVSTEDVRKLHRAMGETAPTANRMLTAVSAVFGWADRAELVPAGTNPAARVEPYREEGRRRALAPDELRALGEAIRARKINASAALAIKLLALTGMRRSEVLGLTWGAVDLKAGLIYLSDSKTGKQTRVIGAAAVALLKAAKSKDAPGDAVCHGAKRGVAFVGIDKIRLRLYAMAGIVETPAGRADLHSLRHSFASVGAHTQSGRYVGMVSALLGHGTQGKSITERYITADPEAMRPAADAIAAEIARLLGLGEPGALLAFPGGAR